MGKATRWFRALFGTKKSTDAPAASSGCGSDSGPGNEKKKRGLGRSFNGNDRNNGGTTRSFIEASSSSPYVEALDANKHAIAVAAATAAVAEAALAAAQAAAEVVRLTSGGSRASTAYLCCDRQRELAAVKIQSAFRAYLARRALRALKGLVKLQALVRGRIVRKQSADLLRRMQAMARIQAQACANRAYASDSPHSSSKSSQSHLPGLVVSKVYDHRLRACNTKLDGSVLKRCGSRLNIKDNVGLERTHLGSNWFDRWMEKSSWNSHRDTLLKHGRADDEKSDKILEIDTWKPHPNPKQSDRAFHTPQHVSAWNHTEQSFTPLDSLLSRHKTKSQKPNTGLSSGKGISLRSLKFPQEVDQAALWNAENSPHVLSASSRPGSSSRRGAFTPARSECSHSFFGDYLGHPNYMANTESSRAKFRSQSAPRQRMQLDKPGSTKRFDHGFWNPETNSERGSTLNANLWSKAYAGSGLLDRPGTPVQGGYSSTYGGRC